MEFHETFSTSDKSSMEFYGFFSQFHRFLCHIMDFHQFAILKILFQILFVVVDRWICVIWPNSSGNIAIYIDFNIMTLILDIPDLPQFFGYTNFSFN